MFTAFAGYISYIGKVRCQAMLENRKQTSLKARIVRFLKSCIFTAVILH